MRNDCIHKLQLKLELKLNYIEAFSHVFFCVRNEQIDWMAPKDSSSTCLKQNLGKESSVNGL